MSAPSTSSAPAPLSFGAPQPASSSAPAPLFSFGAPAASSAAAAPLFSFGAPPSASAASSAAAPAPFTFGAAPSSGAAPAPFSFGLSAPAPAPAAAGGGGLFTFGAPAPLQLGGDAEGGEGALPPPPRPCAHPLSPHLFTIIRRLGRPPSPAFPPADEEEEQRPPSPSVVKGNADDDWEEAVHSAKAKLYFMPKGAKAWLGAFLQGRAFARVLGCFIRAGPEWPARERSRRAASRRRRGYAQVGEVNWTDRGVGVLQVRVAKEKARGPARAGPARGFSTSARTRCEEADARPAALRETQKNGSKPARLVMRNDTGKIFLNAALYPGLKARDALLYPQRAPARACAPPCAPAARELTWLASPAGGGRAGANQGREGGGGDARERGEGGEAPGGGRRAEGGGRGGAAAHAHVRSLCRVRSRLCCCFSSRRECPFQVEGCR